MRLTKEQIEQISKIILNNLRKKDLITIKTNEDIILNKIKDIFLKDLQREEELNREVEKILKTHSSMLSGKDIDYRKMFNLVKTKLAKERNIVI